jgi:hypothetical protein
MSEMVKLDADERIEARPFTDPNHSHQDLRIMRHMAHQLVDSYDDPELCDFLPGKRSISHSDPKGRHFRIYYIQPRKLFILKPLTVVGFFGQKRPGADIEPLTQAGEKFEGEFHKHLGLLSLSTVSLPHGDFGNLVLFTDPGAQQQWSDGQLHRELVPKISPHYYRSIRLNNGVLPCGLEAPDELRLLRVKYLDYSSDPPWRAVRECNDGRFIMAISALARKLRLQDVQRALILNAPQGYLETLGQVPEGLEIKQEPSGQFDFAHLFVKDRSQLERFIDQVLQAIDYDAVLWISYPKGSSGVDTDLTRDKLWEAVSDRGIRPVTQVSIDEVWSAMRFRPPEAVGR